MDGGPAFPSRVTDGGVFFNEDTGRNERTTSDEPGMSLRDYFAANAIQGLVNLAGCDLNAEAALAYRYADAMLAARNDQGDRKDQSAQQGKEG
jgi:hypothetical protein